MFNDERQDRETTDETWACHVDYKKIGKQIRIARHRKDWTQEELAWRLGRTASTVSNLERGVKGTGLEMIVELAACLDVTVDQLLRGNQPQDEQVYLQEAHELLEPCAPEERELVCDLVSLAMEMFDRYTRRMRGGEAK